MRPGLANAFLLGFVESMADFGNPLVLGGNFEVLSTKIFFAVVGAAHDQGRAAVLSIILLGFTLVAFWVQYAWLGKRVYTTVTGKGDSGLPQPLAARRRLALLRDGDPVGDLHARRLRASSWSAASCAPWGATTRRRSSITSPASASRRRRAACSSPASAWNSFFATIEVATHCGADHGRHRAAHRLPAHPPALRRPARLRVRHHAELRHPRHRRRRELYPRLQRAADRDHRHGLHPHHVLRLPQHAGGGALGHRHHEPDRQEPRRGLADPRRPLLRHLAAGGAAAAAGRRSSPRWSTASCGR